MKQFPRNSLSSGDEPAVPASQHLFENLHTIMLIVDPNSGKIRDANPAACRFYGYSRDRLRQLKMSDITLLSRSQLLKVLQQALNQSQQKHTFRHQLADGEFRTVEMQTGPVAGGDGPLLFFVMHDITERERILEALGKSQEQLQQAQKMKALGTLVAGMAHEINNPINLVMFNIPLFRRVWNDLLDVLREHARLHPERKYGGLSVKFLEDNLDGLYADVEMAANRVAKIVSDLKNFSRQTKTTEKKPLDLNTVVQNAVRLAQTVLRKSPTEIVLELAEDLPLFQGNLQGLEQIVLNLSLNAIEAISHDAGRIVIATQWDKGNHRLLLTVADNGKGIDPALAGELFDPFVTDKQNQGGTGLGLSITYSLVKAHEGEIDFQSKPGKGTSFTVTFPLEEPCTHKILIVDDDDQIRAMLLWALERRRFQARDASNGIQACILLGSFHPDVLILDLSMPEMDGLEVCRTIKSEPDFDDVKVIITTGFVHDPRIEEIRRLGFTDILAKPVEISDLMGKLDEVLGVVAAMQSAAAGPAGVS